MLSKLINAELYAEIIKRIPLKQLTEVRLRLGRKASAKNTTDTYTLNYTVEKADIDGVISVATHNSLYAYQDDIRKGFITFNGLRIGVCGEGVTDDKKLITIKNIGSVIIRIPHEVIGVASSLRNITENFENTLIISPPFGGKTTLIRDIARVLSMKHDTLIIDERNEIFNENYTFGNNIDVFSGAPKEMITEGVIRACSPEIIVLDELFPKNDLGVLEEITRSGINALASIHGKNIDDISKNNPTLVSLFTYAITLSNKPRVGSIKSVVRLR